MEASKVAEEEAKKKWSAQLRALVVYSENNRVLEDAWHQRRDEYKKLEQEAVSMIQRDRDNDELEETALSGLLVGDSSLMFDPFGVFVGGSDAAVAGNTSGP